jgi:hypothetical protein
MPEYSTVTLEVPKEAIRHLEALAHLLRGPTPHVDAHDHMKVVDAVIDRYDGLPNAALTMARDSGSRSRDLVVLHRGEWPLKALYFLVMNRVGAGRYSHPREFHSSEAKAYFMDLGLQVRRA